MTTILYGQLDLTKLGIMLHQHDLRKRVKFHDGEHQLLNISIQKMAVPDKHGNTYTIVASCPRAERKENVNYFLCNLKVGDELAQTPNDIIDINH